MHRILIATVLIAGMLATGGTGLEAVLGETVPLSGSAPGERTVYLFMTGPNLDPDGAPLHAPTRSTAAGHYTEVRVLSSGRWEYKWNTGGIGLDAGTYTVYAVTEPRTRRDLRGATYVTTTITLRRAALTLEEEPRRTHGLLKVTVEPFGALIEVDGRFYGTSPLETALSAGTYEVRVTHEGYAPYRRVVTIFPDATTLIEQSLEPIPSPTPKDGVPQTPVASGWTLALAGAVFYIFIRLRK
ncbi:PEGA domain-containing protein [Methanocalculus sp. MSAO_Arc2]|uniref:PEGA domain-containing protein n=1 Tax=Methanocalculus sp. MSAO_Arc2 TaxID=2293855 RepID=UPI0032163FF2